MKKTFILSALLLSGIWANGHCATISNGMNSQSEMKQTYSETRIGLSNLSCDAKGTPGGKLNFKLDISVDRTAYNSKAWLEFDIDGKPIDYDEISLSNYYYNHGYSFSLALPATLTDGTKTLKVKVYSIDGYEPYSEVACSAQFTVGNSGGGGGEDPVKPVDPDNEPDVDSYGNKTFKKRQYHLLELFTATWCRNCPAAASKIAAAEARYGDLAVAAFHGDDQLVFTYTNYMKSVFGLDGYPSINYNRDYKDFKNSRIPYSYYDDNSNGQVLHNNIVKSAMPSVVSIAIAPKYDSYYKTLSMDVNMSCSSFIDEYLNNPALYVLLVEDIGRYKWTVRAMLSPDNSNAAFYGNPIKFNKRKAKLSFKTQLASDWKADNMRIIAFVGERITSNRLTSAPRVTNCEMVDLTGPGTPTAIQNVNASGSLQEIARYNLKGERLSIPVKGINIVKYADGSIRKEIVK